VAFLYLLGGRISISVRVGFRKSVFCVPRENCNGDQGSPTLPYRHIDAAIRVEVERCTTGIVQGNIVVGSVVE